MRDFPKSVPGCPKRCVVARALQYGKTERSVPRIGGMTAFCESTRNAAKIARVWDGKMFNPKVVALPNKLEQFLVFYDKLKYPDLIDREAVEQSVSEDEGSVPGYRSPFADVLRAVDQYELENG